MMNLAQRALFSLSEWLSWQEKAHERAWDLGLERIALVWKRLGAPKIAEYVLTVAGTNGKGSSVAWAEGICLRHGVEVASFTSPHLLDYRERIRFNGKWVSEEALCRAFVAIDKARAEVSLSYFEWSALAAFYLMAEHFPKVAVLEVGLGGRLDAVNLIAADAVVFTKIGLDHQDFLGADLASIAREKAGVMRKGQAVFFADLNPEQALLDCANTLQVQSFLYGHAFSCTPINDGFLFVGLDKEWRLPMPRFMPGLHQLGHFAAVACALGLCFELRFECLKEALLTVVHTARLSVEEGKPRLIFDVAHNEDSAYVLADFLKKMRRDGERFYFVCAMLLDKAHEAVFRAFPKSDDVWFFASSLGARGFKAESLQKAALSVGFCAQNTHVCASIFEAWQLACARAGENDSVVVFGSFVTVAEVLKIRKNGDG